MSTLGKRYICTVCEGVVLCCHAGPGEVACCGQPMQEHQPKPLPSSD